MPMNCDHLIVVVIEVLLNFLLSALLAFWDFYLTFIMGSCCYLSQDKGFVAVGQRAHQDGI